MLPVDDAGSWLLLIIRWVHLLAAAAWVGGSLFYLAVLRPAMRSLQPEAVAGVNPAVGAGFRDLVQASIAILIITGAIMMFDRLAAGVGTLYAALLATKIALSIGMFWLAWEMGWTTRQRRENSRRWPLSPPSLVLAFGFGVFFLALVLRELAQ